MNNYQYIIIIVILEMNTRSIHHVYVYTHSSDEEETEPEENDYLRNDGPEMFEEEYSDDENAKDFDTEKQLQTCTHKYNYIYTIIKICIQLYKFYKILFR